MATDTERRSPLETESFPSPSPAPFRTPSRSVSRHSRGRNSSVGPSSSPPSLPLQHFSPVNNHDSSDVLNDETISPLDPRRFTPTLHANLVSEILSLRRELESRSKEIDNLESSLDDSRTENEALNDSLSKYTKENRSLKRQMQLLEGGTMSALGDLAKERDEAVENLSDVRKRLEQAQKKVKSQEEEADRSHMLWDRDRQSWETERRNWERKVHVVENRLKAILNEVAAAQAAGGFHREQGGDDDDITRDTTTADTTSVRSSSAFDRRRASTTSVSTHDGEPFSSGRFSSMSFANFHAIKGDGLNLADELAFDEEEEEEYLEHAGELPEERPTSVSSQVSYTMAMKARKILGLSMDGSVEHPIVADIPEKIPSDFKRIHEEGERGVLPRIEYKDVAVQYTPPPSPPLPAKLETAAAARGVKDMALLPAREHPDVKDTGILTVPVEMISTSSQTVDLPSPPRLPERIDPEAVAAPVPQANLATMISSTTQTEAIEAPRELEVKEPTSLPAPVPMIAIHPPGSEPASPRSSVVLPPHTKSVSCQTEVEQSQDVRSVAMQTEEIRIDQRPVKLPASLLPSAIIDRPLAKIEPQDIPIPFVAPPPRSPNRNPLKAAAEPVSKTVKGKQPDLVQAYPGNNDNGWLAEDDHSEIRRPFRSSSLFAGFETLSDDEFPEAPLDAFSDDEIYNRPTASYTLRSGKMVTRPGLDENPIREVDEFDIDLPSSTQNRVGPTKRAPRPSKMSSASKPPDIRRTALISNGAAAHQRTRPRSPSEPSIDSVSTGAARPPFPVPVRLSSRKVPTSASEGAQSPTPYSNGNGHYPERNARRITRQPTVRKVRSAATMPRGNAQDRARSRSPPGMSTSAMSTSSYAPDSPQLPPMPMDTRARRSAKKPSSTRPASPSVYSHSREESAAGSVQPTSVVDAIAQTMVGEWMFKYVRRRKSFGMSDSKETWELGKNSDEVSANITSTGVRHKRWVWLAPYERAVMWSSKQPTTGTALLGKSGRKRRFLLQTLSAVSNPCTVTIQSVLDVKDDTPLPKGSGSNSHFNRSILILTPQRALKFTALTLERHYVWLTALSFLSHSSMGVNELATLPPVPQEEFAARPPTATLRRNPIRDSIRVAKGKPRPQASKRSLPAHPVPVPEYPGGGMDMADPIMDAADPPNVPRYAGHSRKRSNTAPRAPPSAFRSFSSHATLPSSYSATTAASSDLYTPSIGGAGLMSGQSSISHRTSEASGPSSINTGNFFDAVGTVRMEAFIDRVDNPRHRGNYRSRHGVRKRESSHWGSNGHDMDFRRSEDGSEVYYRSDDPFRGF